MTNRRETAWQLALFLALFYAAWTLRATVLYAIDEGIVSPTLRAAYADLMKLLLWVLPAVAWVRWVKRVPPGGYWALRRGPERAQWQPCLVATALFLFATAAFEVGTGHKTFSLAVLRSTPLLVGFLSFLVPPLLEELLFRSFVLKETLRLMPLAAANVLTSLLFVGAHLPYWLSHGGLTSPMAARCGGVFLFSLLAGWVFVKSGSVWPAVLAHVANNLLASLLTAAAAR